MRQAINDVGGYYGRRMLTGVLRSHGIRACESLVRSAMMRADPVSHGLRQTDSIRRFNPVLYNAQYFGHKCHVKNWFIMTVLWLVPLMVFLE